MIVWTKKKKRGGLIQFGSSCNHEKLCHCVIARNIGKKINRKIGEVWKLKVENGEKLAFQNFGNYGRHQLRESIALVHRAVTTTH